MGAYMGAASPAVPAPADPGAAFVYSVDFALAPNGVDSNVIRVSNQDFRVHFLVARSDGPFTCLISNGSSRRPLSNIPVRSENLFGTAQQPMPLIVPLLFPVGQGIQVQVTDVSGAANNISIGFIGVEV